MDIGQALWSVLALGDRQYLTWLKTALMGLSTFVKIATVGMDLGAIEVVGSKSVMR